MKLYGVVFLLVTVEAKRLARTKPCEVVLEYPFKKCYIKEVLVSVKHRPNQLAVDRTTNVVYYSFETKEGKYKVASVDLAKKKIRAIPEVKDAFAMAHDPATGDTYFGGSHGLYKYNARRNFLKKLDNFHTWWLFFKEKLYFVEYPNFDAYYYKNGKDAKLFDVLMPYSVLQFVLDKDNTIFFLNGAGLYVIENKRCVGNRCSRPMLVTKYPVFFGMAVDNYGDVYACSENGIFRVGVRSSEVIRVVDVKGALALTFGIKNNIIYSTTEEIVRLLPDFD